MRSKQSPSSSSSAPVGGAELLQLGQDFHDFILHLVKTRNLLLEIAHMEDHRMHDEANGMFAELSNRAHQYCIDITSLPSPDKAKRPLSFSIETVSVQTLDALIEEARAIEKKLCDCKL